MSQTIGLRRFVFLAALALGLVLPATAPAQQRPTPRNGSGEAAPATPPPQEYRLVPGDKLRIEVYQDAQLSQSAQVRPDGKITLPLIGDITAIDRTPTELRDAITGALKEYVNNPSVTVIVVETVTPTAYVMGEVREPGAVPLHRATTVLQALALAGGLTEFANTKNIRILRQTGTGVETIPFRYREALEGSAQTQMLLQAGDTVIVP